MTKYQKGAIFERQVRDYLESKGADVTRSAGSHTCKDVVAVFPKGIVWYVQCKTDGNLKNDEREELLRLKKTHNIIPILAYKEKGKMRFSNIKSKTPDFSFVFKDGHFTKVENE